MPKQTHHAQGKPLRARMDALIERLTEQSGDEDLRSEVEIGPPPALPLEPAGTSLDPMRSQVPGE